MTWSYRSAHRNERIEQCLRNLAVSAAAGVTQPGLSAGRYPVGLQLYSVRKAFRSDVMGALRAVSKMGYGIVEFWSPYFSWSPGYAGVRWHSSHSAADAFTAANLSKAIELNGILGSRFIVMAGWRTRNSVAASPPTCRSFRSRQQIACTSSRATAVSASPSARRLRFMPSSSRC